MTVSITTEIKPPAQEKKKDVPFEDAITIAGFGLYNIRILLATGLCLMCVLVETTSMMFIVPTAQCDLELSLVLKGVLGSIAYAGIIPSSHLWGYLADTHGRRFVLIISLSVSAITSFFCTIVPWAWLFILLRFINGFFISGTSSVVYAFNGEFQNNHYRPKVISWMASFVAITNIFLPGTAWLILPQQWSYYLPGLDFYFRPWRLLLVIYSLPCLLAALLVYLLPESPKFLLTQNRHDDALRILQRMYELNKWRNAEDYPVESIHWEDLNVEVVKIGLMKSMWEQTVPLFRKSMLFKTLLVCFIQYGAFFSSAGVAMWYAEILNKLSHYAHLFPNESISLCNSLELLSNKTTSLDTTCVDTIRTDVFLAVMTQGAIFTVLYLIIGSVINFVGKKNIMYIFLSIAAISGIAAEFVQDKETIQILLIFFLIGGVGIGINNTIVVDIYPTHIRATALAISLMFGRFGAITSTNITGPIIYNFCDSLFFIFAAMNALLIMALTILPSQPSEEKSQL